MVPSQLTIDLDLIPQLSLRSLRARCRWWFQTALLSIAAFYNLACMDEALAISAIRDTASDGWKVGSRQLRRRDASR